MNLEIISPKEIIYSGIAESVTLPGLKGAFTILDRHAPIISILKKGELHYRMNENNARVYVNEGFVEVKKNKVSVCIE